jgi:hypothetical protein
VEGGVETFLDELFAEALDAGDAEEPRDGFIDLALGTIRARTPRRGQRG